MIPSQQYRFLRHSLRDGRSINPQDSSRWTKLHLDPWLLCFLVLNAILGLMVVYSATSEDSGHGGASGDQFWNWFCAAVYSVRRIPPKVYQAISPYLVCLRDLHAASGLCDW